MASELSKTLKQLSIKESELQEELDKLSSEKKLIQHILNENEELKKKVDEVESLDTSALSALNIMFEKFLEKHFKRLGLEYSKIKAIFDGKNVFLTGSIVLMGLIGEWWISDIDIVTTKASAEEVMMKLGLAYGAVFKKVDRNEDSAYFKTLFNNTSFLKSELYRGELKNIKIDVIVVQDDPIELIRTFDFRFCRNYWDGKVVHCLSPWSVRNKKHQITKESLKGLSYREMHETAEYRKSRAEKYRIRGFTIAPYYRRVWDSDEDETFSEEDVE